MKKNTYLPHQDATILRQKAIFFFKNQVYLYKNLDLRLAGDRLNLVIKKQEELPNAIKSSKPLYDSARICLGITGVDVILGKTKIFSYSGSRMSSRTGVALQSIQESIKAGTRKMQTAMMTATIEKNVEDSADIPANLLKHDELIPMAEIAARTGIKEKELEEYVCAESAIKIYRLRGEILIPGAIVRLAVEGYFAWTASREASNALAILAEQMNLSPNSKNPTSSEVAIPENPASTDGDKPKSGKKGGKSAYKLPSDFKISNSYSRTIKQAVASQGNKEMQCLKDVADKTPEGLVFLEKLAAKHKNVSKAEFGLHEAATLELMGRSN